MKSAEGSIYKASDGRRWVARVQYSDVEGRRRQKVRYCVTHAAAKSKVKQLQSEIEDLKSDRVSFRQLDAFFRREYLHEAKFVGGQKISGFRQSIVAIKGYLDTALKYFGDMPIDEVRFAHLQSYKKLIAAKPTRGGSGVRSVSDVNHHMKRVRRLFTIAVEQGWLTVNPFSRGSGLIQDSFEVERTRILSPVEENRLLAECVGRRKYLRPIVIFAIETGCRRGEMKALKWSDVNFEGRYIKIVGTSTKTLKSRLVPISDRLAETMAELWRNSVRRQNADVFGNASFRKAFTGACAAADLPDVHFHDLRHTAITRMLEKGISPPLVMKISGHTQQKTFLRYVNQSESSIFEIAAKLSRAA